MHDIFLSYAKEDKPIAKTIAQALEKEGFDVWWDIDIPTGGTFDTEIEKAIDNTKCVVALWSKYSINSEWVRIEAAEGKARNILIPVRIEDVVVPLAFRRRQFTDLIDWDKKTTDSHFRNLVEDIRLIVDGKQSDKSTKVEVIDKKKIIDLSSKNFKIGFSALVIIIISFWIGNYFFYPKLTENLYPDFEQSENLGAPYNSDQNDYAFFIDSELNMGYFSSNRAYGMGGLDIYSFESLSNDAIKIGNFDLQINTQFNEISGFVNKNTFYYIGQKVEEEYDWEAEFPSVIYQADMISEGAFGDVQELKSYNVNSNKNIDHFTLTQNGKIMYFSRLDIGYDSATEDSIKNKNIYRAELFEGEWITNKKLPFNNDQFSTFHPCLSPDDKQLYFVSNMPHESRGKTDIFVVNILDNNEYSNPINLGDNINTVGSELFPFIAKDSTLYFSSDGHKDGFGEFDIYKSNDLRKNLNLKKVN